MSGEWRGRGEEVRDGDGETALEKQPQEQGSGERRAWGAGRRGLEIQKEKKRLADGKKPEEGRLGWAPGSGGLAWALECGHWLCSLHLQGGWVWMCRVAGVQPSRKCASVPALHPPHLGRALEYHLALRADALHTPSKCTEMSPSPPARQAPASPMPPTQEAKFSLNLSHRRLVGNMLLPTPHLPLFPPCSSFFLSLSFSLPLPLPLLGWSG